jgi:hypothetical protein
MDLNDLPGWIDDNRDSTGGQSEFEAQLIEHVRELRAALNETIHTSFETWPYAQRDNHHLLSRETPPEVKP